ncbi:transcriptional regulator (WYL domain) [Campylobacter iguaniorum]|uniref:Transcriptional regulator (WYL domain) n=1 Tax=Campylobacter iguaniorum TaxID=1244531 RepID=A0A076FAA5_9BACT|nr:WYL domain-containing transcriptional regulator [Campylobacter iguaniorum]AII14881.1 transcriptional regulator (WYL domain) [Campylobacter iguaniorum]
MKNKKIFEILELLDELTSGREVLVKNYAIKSGLSERTIRRYIQDLREFFGEDTIFSISQGSYICKNKELFQRFVAPNERQDESEKLIDMLHIINPGFSKFMPHTYKKVDDKLKKELASVFLIKGSPHEQSPNLKIFGLIQKAIKFRRYCDLTYNETVLKNVKIIKIIYSKGNWQLATLCDTHENNGYKVLRLCFIKDVVIKKAQFYIDDYTENFVRNSETFMDGYKKEPYECVVAVSPNVAKYFEQKRFFHSQKIVGKCKNGWVKISYEITSDEMMIMQLRRWFPDMVVLSPISLRDNFSKILENYNKSLNEFD